MTVVQLTALNCDLNGSGSRRARMTIKDEVGATC